MSAIEVKAPRQGRAVAGRLGLNLLTYVVAFLAFFPILWTLLTAFKTEANAAAIPPVIWFHATLDQFRAVINSNYLSYFENSANVTSWLPFGNAFVPRANSYVKPTDRPPLPLPSMNSFDAGATASVLPAALRASTNTLTSFCPFGWTSPSPWQAQSLAGTTSLPLATISSTVWPDFSGVPFASDLLSPCADFTFANATGDFAGAL